jgi:hypothetical protein
VTLVTERAPGRTVAEVNDERPTRLLAPIGVGTHREVGGVEEDIFGAGDAHIKRVVYPPGYRWSVNLKPHVGTDLCMHAHVGFLAEGHMRIEYADGCEIDVVAPQPVVIHPGHDAAVVGDDTAVFIQFDFDRDTAERMNLPLDHDHTD